MKNRKWMAAFLTLCMMLTSSQLVKAATKQTIFNSAAMLSGKQTGAWQYLTRDSVSGMCKEGLQYKSNSKTWEDGNGGMIGNGMMHTSAEYETQVVLQFTCPYPGNIDILDKNGYVSVDKNTVNGVKLMVHKGNKLISETMVINASCNYKKKFVPINVNVKEGDKIRFILSANGSNEADGTNILPLINYTKIGNVGALAGADIVPAPKTSNGGLYSIKDQFSSSNTGVWRYVVRDMINSKFIDMKWDKSKSEWTDGAGGAISGTYLQASAATTDEYVHITDLQFVAPNSGNLTIYSLDGLVTVSDESTNGVGLGILHNGTWLDSPVPNILESGERYVFKPITIDVVEGDNINFMLFSNNDNKGDKLGFSPVIVYNKAAVSLSTLVKLPKEGTEATGVYNFSKAFSSTQGSVWKYVRRGSICNRIEELKYDAANKNWNDGGSGIVTSTWIHTSADSTDEWMVGQQFIAPKEGNITVYSVNGIISVSPDSDDGVRMGVMKNGSLIKGWDDIGSGEKYVFEPMTMNVDAGDTLTFLFAQKNNNASDVTEFAPVVVYNAYEKIVTPIEIREDDPAKTVYNCWEEFGPYCNPWYYKYWIRGTQTPLDMEWVDGNDMWICPTMGACFLGKDIVHPGVQERPVRVFKAPKSGTVNISVLNNVVCLGAEVFSEGEDGVYVSIFLYDGDSTTELMAKEWLNPAGGTQITFKNIENIKIYEGWEIWFVIDCFSNNANDAVIFAPAVTYTEITDEKAPVFLNLDQETIYCSEDYLNLADQKSDFDFPVQEVLLNLGGIVIVLALAGIVIPIMKKGRKQS